MSRMYGFHAPQEKIEPRFWKSTQDFSDVNTGRFVRNAVLSSVLYNGSDLAPAYLKTRDAIHPLFGCVDQLGAASSVYGGMGASASVDAARAILSPQNTGIWWSPGGNGVNSWVMAKLPEATLVETYLVGSKSSTCPLSWKLQGSLDGTTWTDIHVVETSGAWDATYEGKTFTIPEASRGSYLYYRLYTTSSNATTMSLRLFRLFRASSVCSKGQLLLDASSSNPLLMSFANGYAVDGETPVDNQVTLSARTNSNMFDSSGYPIIHGTPITAPMSVNVYAVRGSNGAVTLEYEDAGGEIFLQANGGMRSASDKGWTCSPDNSALYSKFGRPATSGDGPSAGTYTIISSSPVYVKNIRCNMTFPYTVYAIEIGGSDTLLYKGRSAPGENLWAEINRTISGIKVVATGTGYLYNILAYSPSAPLYRFTNGKLYTRASSGDSWTQCQKIKLGSIVLGTDGEVYQPLAFSALQLQWMTNGDAETFLGA